MGKLCLAIVALTALLSLLAVGCSADSEVDCSSGDIRSCGTCRQLHPYVGCGQLGPIVAMATEGTETCTSHGTWGPCSCLVDVEPECTSEPTEQCVQDCSSRIHLLGYSLPAGASDAACRQAYVALLECAGQGCGWIGDPGADCEAELQTLDLECLGVTAPGGCY